MAELQVLRPAESSTARADRWKATVLKAAIAAQHGLGDAPRHELCICEGCGAPYLLLTVWQPHADAGELACPRCGVVAVTWDGTRSYLAFWQRAA